VLIEAIGHGLYCNAVVFMSACNVLRSLEKHQCCKWPSAYNLLHRLFAQICFSSAYDWHCSSFEDSYALKVIHITPTHKF